MAVGEVAEIRNDCGGGMGQGGTVMFAFHGLRDICVLRGIDIGEGEGKTQGKEKHMTIYYNEC